MQGSALQADQDMADVTESIVDEEAKLEDFNPNALSFGSKPPEHLPNSQHSGQQQLDLEDMLAQLKYITTSLKPVSSSGQSDYRFGSAVQDDPHLQSPSEQHDAQLMHWLVESLSLDRFRKMNANLEALCDSSTQAGQLQQLQKAKEIELLALKLDIEQANEINRGKQYNIIKK